MLGLSILSKHGVSVPKIIIDQTKNAVPYLLLAYIDNDGIFDDSQLAQSLSSLHANKAEYFGLDHDNYIGSLPQNNRSSECIHSFLVESRFLPQIELAKQNGYIADLNCDSFLKRISSLVPVVSPSLIHGDLWNGNLLGCKGLPIFIDPSVSFSHPEFDLGMMLLFGGFSTTFFEIFEELNPSVKGFRSRADVFQLYYLLVHLNLFGRSYEGRVIEILKRYV